MIITKWIMIFNWWLVCSHKRFVIYCFLIIFVLLLFGLNVLRDIDKFHKLLCIPFFTLWILFWGNTLLEVENFLYESIMMITRKWIINWWLVGSHNPYDKLSSPAIMPSFQVYGLINQVQFIVPFDIVLLT